MLGTSTVVVLHSGSWTNEHADDCNMIVLLEREKYFLRRTRSHPSAEVLQRKDLREETSLPRVSLNQWFSTGLARIPTQRNKFIGEPKWQKPKWQKPK